MGLIPVPEGLQGKSNTLQSVEKTSLSAGIACDSEESCFSTMESSPPGLSLSGRMGQVRLRSQLFPGTGPDRTQLVGSSVLTVRQKL